MHCIWFFGSNNFAWIEEYSIKPYLEFKEKLSKTCKTALFKRACGDIEDYITRKAAGEDVDSQFDEVEGEEGGTNDGALAEEPLNDEDEEEEEDDEQIDMSANDDDFTQEDVSDPTFRVSPSAADKSEDVSFTIIVTNK